MEINVNENLPMLDNGDAKALADAIAEILDSKKARDIKVLHVEDKTVIAEYFVLCTGNSSTQVKALAGEVEFFLLVIIAAQLRHPARLTGRADQILVRFDQEELLLRREVRPARIFGNDIPCIIEQHH